MDRKTKDSVLIGHGCSMNFILFYLLQVPFWLVAVLIYLNFIFSKNILASLYLKDAAGYPAKLIYVSARLFGILSEMIVIFVALVLCILMRHEQI